MSSAQRRELAEKEVRRSVYALATPEYAPANSKWFNVLRDDVKVGAVYRVRKQLWAWLAYGGKEDGKLYAGRRQAAIAMYEALLHH